LDPVANIPSTKLQLVKDDQEFEWRTIQDWIPKDHEKPMPYNTMGMIGFDFDTKFVDAQFESDDGPYKYPFLAILQHLWPSKWKDHLCHLNAHITTECDEKRMEDQQHFW
jgi:hypothetical protein